jgi:predicted PurR-regulated permease PerM
MKKHLINFVKNNLITLVVVAMAIFFTSAAIVNSPTSRSSQQVVIHSDNVYHLTNQINNYYSKGYRVVEMESQSVSDATGATGAVVSSKGEIIVIMEK